MAPSNPEFVFPACPHCLEEVTTTDLDEGGVYLVDGVPRPGSSARVAVRASQIAGDTNVGERVAGAPEIDRLTLHPCGHHLTGAAVWVYNLEAARRTFPAFRVELRVIVPAPLTGTDAPQVYTMTATADVDELLTSDQANPMAQRLRNLFTLAEQALPEWCPPATATPTAAVVAA